MKPYINFLYFNVSSYGLFMLVAVTVVFLFALNRAKRLNILVEDVIIILSVSLGFILLGGYLTYIFVTYPFMQIVGLICQGNLKFLQNAGLVFYGGVGGAIIGVAVSLGITKISLDDLCFVFVPFVPLGHAIGRIGCYFAGCCRGKEYSGPLAVYYRNSIFGLSPTQGYFPVQPAEALINILICCVLVSVSKRIACKKDIIFMYFLMYASARFLLEFLRGDSERGFFLFLSTSQWISFALIIVSLIYCFFIKKKF